VSRNTHRLILPASTQSLLNISSFTPPYCWYFRTPNRLQRHCKSCNLYAGRPA